MEYHPEHYRLAEIEALKFLQIDLRVDLYGLLTDSQINILNELQNNESFEIYNAVITNYNRLIVYSITNLSPYDNPLFVYDLEKETICVSSPLKRLLRYKTKDAVRNWFKAYKSVDLEDRIDGW